MDQGNQPPLSPQEIAQLQALARRFQLSHIPFSDAGPPAIQLAETNRTPPSPSTVAPTTLTPAAEPYVIPTYQSIRVTPGVTQPGPVGAPATLTPAETLPMFGGSSQGHPSTSVMPSTQPFLGFSNLGNSMTGQVNRERLRASAAHIPRQPRLPSRGQRRGPAIHPPGLPRPPKISDCYTPMSVNGTSTPGIRITVKVYPPTESSSKDIFVYRLLHDSFDAILQSWNLIYSYELPQSTTVTDLITRIIGDMESCPYSYQFTTIPSTSSLLVHEVHPLQPLEITNRGIPRNDNQVRLRRGNHAHQTLWNLTQNRYFAVPALSVEGNRFVIHFVVRNYPLIATTCLDGDTTPRLHSCVSRKIYSTFGHDGVLDNTANDNNDSSSEDESSGPSVPTQPTATRQHRSRLIQSASEPPTYPQPLGASEGTLRRDPSLSSFTFLPPRIWDISWVAAEPRYRGFFTSDLFAEAVYELAVGQLEEGDRPSLDVRAQDVDGLVLLFEEIIGEAVDAEDFTKVLAPQRQFIIMSQNTRGRRQTVRSLGDGVEREVIHMLFEKFRRAGSQWFTPRADGHSTLATTNTMSSARYISRSRLRHLGLLGAITALSLLHGMAATPLDPVFLHFLIHECNIASIHEGMLSEWHPELRQTISRWIEVGPHADITEFQTHFAIYHDIQIATLQGRSEESHAAMAAEMLYRSVIGTEPPNHPEMRAFLQGLKLPCRSGLTFFDVIKSWDGGSEKFFTDIWSSHISSYHTLLRHLQLVDPPVVLQGRLDAASAFTNGSSRVTFLSLLASFLQGAGIPRPDLFASAREHFNPIIDLNAIEEGGFRAKMFCWAATGSSERATDSPAISVCFIADDDGRYGTNNDGMRAAMLREGRISFQTCFSKVLIPATHIINIAAESSSSGADQTSFFHAVDHWLLCEVLNAIGSHTVA